MIQNVGLNPTRSALLDFLLSIGAPVKVLKIESVNGELIGDIEVRHAPVRGGVIEKELTAALIDEIPVLAVLGAASEEGLIDSRCAGAARSKRPTASLPSRRTSSAWASKLKSLPDGMRVPGKQKFRAAAFDSFGDHRIAMAFAVAALRGDGESTIDNADAASVSFPEFWNILAA